MDGYSFFSLFCIYECYEGEHKIFYNYSKKNTFGFFNLLVTFYAISSIRTLCVSIKNSNKIIFKKKRLKTQLRLGLFFHQIQLASEQVGVFWMRVPYRLRFYRNFLCRAEYIFGIVLIKKHHMFTYSKGFTLLVGIKFIS